MIKAALCRQALEDVATGHTRGKVVIEVSSQ